MEEPPPARSSSVAVRIDRPSASRSSESRARNGTDVSLPTYRVKRPGGRRYKAIRSDERSGPSGGTSSWTRIPRSPSASRAPSITSSSETSRGQGSGHSTRRYPAYEPAVPTGSSPWRRHHSEQRTVLPESTSASKGGSATGGGRMTAPTPTPAGREDSNVHLGSFRGRRLTRFRCNL